MRALFISLLLTAIAALPLGAQKYGHLNFANLLSEMPGTAAAESELAEFNTQLVTRGEEMVAELQTAIQEVQGQVDDLTPVQLAERRTALSQQRDEIAAYEQQIQVELERKRQELLGPLIQQARDAIDTVAASNGYELVFDTSLFNTILFAEDADDLMLLVKAQLGI